MGIMGGEGGWTMAEEAPTLKEVFAQVFLRKIGDIFGEAEAKKLERFFEEDQKGVKDNDYV